MGAAAASINCRVIAPTRGAYVEAAMISSILDTDGLLAPTIAASSVVCIATRCSGGPARSAGHDGFQIPRAV